MAYHEFGIIENDPKVSQRFDGYEPGIKYIKINDDFIEPLLPEFNSIRCYWHSLKHPEMNLAYFGITLIPPVLRLSKYKSLLINTRRENNA
ncbi:MAG: hypothetical protein M0P14_02520 [Alkaliphilus sp.]|nr:hypothetical protein [Alkaliphilus sp.]